VIQLAQPALRKVIQVSTDGNTWYTVGGLNDASISRGGEILDDTEFDENHDGFRSRMASLRDWSVNASGDYDPTDTTGQGAILAAWIDGTPLHVKYLPAGTSGGGVKGQCVVESIDEGGAVADKETFSFVLQADGKLEAV
jgi:predicted secreted protein